MRGRIDENKARMLVNDPIARIIPRMAIPTIVAQMITVIYNLTDTFFVSRLGTAATAAVGVNHTLEMTINTVAMLIGGGAASYIARLLGAEEKDHADRVFSASLCTCIVFGVVFAAACLSMMLPLVNLLGADDNCRQFAIDYGSYVLLAAPFMIVAYMLNQCLRSEGSATLAMVGIGFGGILNCFLDPLFIFYLGLGVKGASMATAISKVVSCSILVYPYLRGRSVISPSIRKLKVSFKDVKEVIGIGSTSFFRSGTSVLANTLMNRAASTVSTSMLAAISISSRIMQFPFNVILGFGAGFQPVAGFNWGAKRYDRVRESLGFVEKLSLIGGALMGVAGFIAAPALIGIFNSSSDPGVLAAGILCVRLQCIALPAHALLSIINMFYAGTGKVRQALIISLARQGYCFIPCLYILPFFLGETGLVCVQAGADALTLFISVPLCIKAAALVRDRMAEASAA